MPKTILEAIEHGDSARVREILEQDPAAARARNEAGVSALLWALYPRAQEAVELILATQPELDVSEAAALGRDTRLRDLMRADATVLEHRSADGFTPLHLACFFGRESTVELLLEGGADANAVADGPSKVQPLHSAAASRSQAIVRALLRNGASVNARQQGGFTALHAAVQHDDLEMTRMLLEYGADPDQPDEEGVSALDRARAREHPEITALLAGE